MTLNLDNIIVVIGAIATLSTALLGYAKSVQNGNKLSDTRDVIEDVHKLSNGRLTHALDRIAQLEKVISLLGYTVPTSLPLTPTGETSDDPNVTQAIPVIPPARPYVALPKNTKDV